MQKFKGESMKRAKKHDTHAFSQFTLTQNLLNNLSQFEITPTAKLVLLYLSSCYNPKKADVFPKQKTIAAKTGISERSVVRAVQELIKEGVIVVECKYSNRYRFTSKIIAEQPVILKNFEQENLSDDLRKNVIDKVTKSRIHDIEPKKEQKNNPQDDKYLLKYAESRGVKNKIAYINAIKRNGGANEIIKEFKQIEAKKRFVEQEHQRLFKELKEAKENAAVSVPDGYFENVRRQILEQKKALQ